MQRGFAQKGGADLVLGFSGYIEQPGLLNKLIRYETLLHGGAVFGLGLGRTAIHGCGPQPGLHPRYFQSTKGFASHIRRLSGDDDLLVQDAVALGARVAVVADPPAQTLSQPARHVGWLVAPKAAAPFGWQPLPGRRPCAAGYIYG